MNGFRRKICLGTALLILLGLLFYDLSLSFQSNVPTGVDGYYYVLQVDSLVTSGDQYFQTATPLILYLLAIVSLLIGNTISAIKIGALFLQIALCVGIAGLVHNLTKNIWLVLTSVFLSLWSLLHLYFLSEFVSNLGFAAFFVWGCFGIAKGASEKKKSWYFFGALMFLFSCLSHRTGIWIVASTFALFFFARWWLKAKLPLIALLPVLVLVIASPLLAWQGFVELPNWLSEELLKYPKSPFHSLVLMESIISLAFFAVVLALILVRRKWLNASIKNTFLLTFFLWTVLFTLNPFLNHAAGISRIVGRIGVIQYVFVAISIPLLFTIFLSHSTRLAAVALALFLPLLFLRWCAPFPVGLRSDYLNRRERLVRDLPQMRGTLCDNPVIIAQHGEQFLVTAVLGIPSQQTPPKRDFYSCVIWLVHENGKAVFLSDVEIRKALASLSGESRRAFIQENQHVRRLLNPI